MSDDHKIELLRDERDLRLYQAGKAAMAIDLQEGAWTGSQGGHDPDQLKMKNGLMDWWRKKVATDPHPFRYCVEHLSKHVANPERLCAWLKDQAMGTTKWRNGGKKGLKESQLTEADVWEPSREDLISAVKMFAADNPDDTEIGALAELAQSMEGETGGEGSTGDEAAAGAAGGNVEQGGEGAGAEGAEAGGAGTEAPAPNAEAGTGSEVEA